jgi:hypothetical protein
MTGVGLSNDVFDRWLSIDQANVGMHVLYLCRETNGSPDDIIEELRSVVRAHYVAPETTAKRLSDLGAPETAKTLREHLPVSKTARSGDLGEVLATELTERRLGFRVPIRRLRWKDGRDMALRGDDIVAVARDRKMRLVFLKGESKSRVELTSTVVTAAEVALDSWDGRPTRHSVYFVADRLRDQGEHDLAKELETAVLKSYRGCVIEHLLFTVSGNDPGATLSQHLCVCINPIRRHAVGVLVVDVGRFIERLFSEF